MIQGAPVPDERVVFVIEDEPDIARIIGLALKLVGRLRVVTCTAEADIPGMVAEKRPNLILLDRILSGKDGLAVCKQLKAAPETRSIPIVFLSAKCTEADREEGFAAGASGYLAKPFDPMELADQIRAVIPG